MRKLVNIFYDVRKEEWMTTSLMFLLHFMLMATLYFLKPARDSLFLSQIGPRQLPFVYLLLAAISVPVSIFMSKYLRRYTARFVLQWSLLFFVLNLLALRWAFSFEMQWIYLVFYLWVGIFGILVISQFWLYANALYNAAQSKRLFSFLNLGAILGAIAGSQTSTILVAWLNLSTQNLLYVSMGVLGAAAGLIFWINRSDISGENEDGASESQVASEKEESSSITYSTRDIFRTVVNSRYQLLIAGIIGFAMLVSTLVDYQFKTVANQVYPGTTALTSFLGSFYAGISVASLLIQVLLSAPIIKRLGLGGAVLARPASILLGAVLFLFEPVLAVAVYMQGFDRATRYSIDKTGRELLFLPLQQSVKRKTKIFMDIFVNRFFRGIAGLMLLAFIFWADFSVEKISYVVIAMLAVWISLGFWARREYVEKFRDSLRKRYIDVDQITLNLDQPVVFRAVREMLQSDNSSRIIYALTMLENSKVPKVAPELRHLLHHSHSEIRLRALHLLQKVHSLNITDDVEALVNDQNPEVRLEAVNYLCRHGDDEPVEIMRSYLDHEDENLRYAALVSLHKHDAPGASEVDEELLEEVLQRDDEDSVVLQAQVAQLLGYMPDHPKGEEYLSTLLAREERVVVEKTLQSIRRLQDQTFMEELLNKLQSHRFVNEVQQTLASFGESCLDTYQQAFFDESTELAIREQIPGIFTYLAKQVSVDYLMEMLSEENPRLRYKVIKALNKLNRRRRSFDFDQEKISRAIKYECHVYFKLLSAKMVQRTDIPDNILIIAIKEKMDQAKERLFRLVGLMHDQQDIYGSYLALRSNSDDARAASVEFIENVLSAGEQEYILPIIDTPDDEEKLEMGCDLFDDLIDDYEEGMLMLLEGDDVWLRACAIFSVSSRCPASLHKHVREAASDDQPQIVRETAEYVLKRNKNS